MLVRFVVVLTSCACVCAQSSTEASAVHDMLVRNRQELLGDRLSSQTPPVTSQPPPQSRVQLEEIPIIGDYAQVKVRMHSTLLFFMTCFMFRCANVNARNLFASQSV